MNLMIRGRAFSIHSERWTGGFCSCLQLSWSENVVNESISSRIIPQEVITAYDTASKHGEELEAYNKANRYIRARYSDGKVPAKTLQAEKKKLESEVEDPGFRKEDMKDEVSWIRKIDSMLNKLRPEIYEEIKKEKESEEKKRAELEKAKTAEKKEVKKTNAKESEEPVRDEPTKPENRPSLRKRMETMKKDLDERDNPERERGPRIIKRDRDEPSL